MKPDSYSSLVSDGNHTWYSLNAVCHQITQFFVIICFGLHEHVYFHNHLQAAQLSHILLSEEDWCVYFYCNLEYRISLKIFLSSDFFKSILLMHSYLVLHMETKHYYYNIHKGVTVFSCNQTVHRIFVISWCVRLHEPLNDDMKIEIISLVTLLLPGYVIVDAMYKHKFCNMEVVVKCLPIRHNLPILNTLLK